MKPIARAVFVLGCLTCAGGQSCALGQDYLEPSASFLGDYDFSAEYHFNIRTYLLGHVDNGHLARMVCQLDRGTDTGGDQEGWALDSSSETTPHNAHVGI
ncbi:MAG TPA: hypothetical protein VKA15_07005, partial [Isosphaeraceae bacterium]|nr:hypothetical protein [Isosphaeraceae bacterium]